SPSSFPSPLMAPSYPLSAPRRFPLRTPKPGRPGSRALLWHGPSRPKLLSPAKNGALKNPSLELHLGSSSGTRNRSTCAAKNVLVRDLQTINVPCFSPPQLSSSTLRRKTPHLVISPSGI